MPRKAKPLATFDIETDPFKKGRKILTPFCADFFDGFKNHTFWGDDCLEECVKVMLKFNGKIYAHNGGKFDFHFLLNYLPDELSLFCIDSRIAWLKTGDTSFLDSYLILPISLSKFGNKLDIEYWKLEKEHREKYKDEIIQYLRQDTRGLFDGVTDFRNRFGDALTLASASFKQMQKFGIKPPRHKKRFRDEMFRPFYFGGRTECFKGGETVGDLIYIDINSAYPNAMMKNHPFGFGYVERENINGIRDELLQTSFIHFWGVSEGVLPCRKKDGGIYFPKDKLAREYFSTGWEFLSGMKRGKIRVYDYKKVLVPTETQNFSDFVNHFYSEKLEAKKRGDSNGELFAKLMLNSSYGRFAINPDKWREHLMLEIGEMPDETPDEEPWTFTKDFEESGFSLFERPVNELEKAWYNVATASSVTGCVRAFLSESLDSVDTPIYCDTDSIIAYSTGNLKLGDKLGEWKIEAEGKRVFVGGKKLYAFECSDGEWKTASKGSKLTVEEIKKVCRGESIKWESEAPNYSIKKTTVEFISRTIQKTLDLD